MPTPSKFTESVKAQILDVLRIGGTLEMGCRVAGVDPSQGTRWMRRGREQPKGSFHDFVVEVEKARTQTPLRALGVIYQELPNNPAIALKVVERKVEGWAPPQPEREKPTTPLRIELTLAPQPLTSLPASTIEVLEQNSRTDSTPHSAA